MFNRRHNKENQEYKLIDAKKILNGLGGKENIIELTNCITRLRLRVRDTSVVNVDLLKHETGASDVVIEGNSVQVIYGLKIEIIRKAIDVEMSNN